MASTGKAQCNAGDHGTPNCRSIFARAPGRVNMIGEHIDYCGYGVLPCALADQDVRMFCAASKRHDAATNVVRLTIQNVDAAAFPDRTIEIPLTQDGLLKSSNVVINKEDHFWTNYVLCGLKAALSLLSQGDDERGLPVAEHEWYLLTQGNVPVAAGLSSSSALVCCSALAFMFMLVPDEQKRLSLCKKRELAQLCADSERHVGTESGAMDQSASFLGKAGDALYVSFEPKLDAREVALRLGSEYSIVIANCLRQSKKAENPELRYNRRVVECAMAFLILAKNLLSAADFDEHVMNYKGGKRPTKTLHWLQEYLGLSADALLEQVEKLLPAPGGQDSWTLLQVAEKIGITFEQLKQFLSRSKIESHMDGLKLLQRAKHVVSEADRVLRMIDIKSQPSDSTQALALYYGKLMNASHESCNLLYECSCDELQALRSTFLQSDACVGCRLTGAGWGGCVVALVKSDQLSGVVSHVWNSYYVEKLGVAVEMQPEVLFATVPGSGAGFISII